MSTIAKTRDLLKRAFFESTLRETLDALPPVERDALRKALEAAREAWPEDAAVVAMLAMITVASESASVH